MAHNDALPVPLGPVVRVWSQDAASVPLARSRLRTDLEAWGLPELVADAELVLGELLANSIRHARPVGQVIETRHHRRPGGGIRLEVRDRDADRLPRVRPLSADLVSGRGLQLVEAYTGGRWGVRVQSRGKTVWADVGTL